jgi:hypothetical protein
MSSSGCAAAACVMHRVVAARHICASVAFDAWLGDGAGHTCYKLLAASVAVLVGCCCYCALWPPLAHLETHVNARFDPCDMLRAG